MRVEDLSGTDAEVYRAIAELEDAENAPHASDIARRAGLDLEQTRASLRTLTSDPGLVREVPDAVQPDLGPVYELVERA